MVKVTHSLDDATVQRIRRIAKQLGEPQSQVVREAVADFAARTDRLSEVERLRMTSSWIQRVASAWVPNSAAGVPPVHRDGVAGVSQAARPTVRHTRARGLEPPLAEEARRRYGAVVPTPE